MQGYQNFIHVCQARNSNTLIKTRVQDLNDQNIELSGF